MQEIDHDEEFLIDDDTAIILIFFRKKMSTLINYYYYQPMILLYQIWVIIIDKREAKEETCFAIMMTRSLPIIGPLDYIYMISMVLNIYPVTSKIILIIDVVQFWQIDVSIAFLSCWVFLLIWWPMMHMQSYCLLLQTYPCRSTFSTQLPTVEICESNSQRCF